MHESFSNGLSQKQWIMPELEMKIVNDRPPAIHFSSEWIKPKSHTKGFLHLSDRQPQFGRAPGPSYRPRASEPPLGHLLHGAWHSTARLRRGFVPIAIKGLSLGRHRAR